MRVFAREGDTLFATLTPDELDRIQAYGGRARGDTAEVDLDAWFDAAEKVTDARESNEQRRDLFERQVAALADVLVPGAIAGFESVTLADWLRAVQAVGKHCERLVKLREHFENEIREISQWLDEMSPAELKR